MKQIQLSEDIVPLAKFKASASEIIRQLRAGQRPVVITQHGKPAAVLITPELFDELSERERLLLAVRDGMADLEAGRVVEDDALSEHLDQALGPLMPE